MGLIKYSDNNYFIESKSIQVFPCSYRGSYTEDNITKIFNTEARLNTEKNLVNPTGRLEINSRKSGYIISATETEKVEQIQLYNIELNIGGYYIKLQEIAKEDLYINDSPLTLCVKLSVKNLNGTESSEKTELLDSWTDSGNMVLDRPIEVEGKNKYIFTGLLFSAATSTPTDAKYAIQLVVKAGDKWIFNPRLFLPNIISNSDNSGGIEIPEGTVTIGNPGATKTFELNEKNAAIYVPLTIDGQLTVKGTNTLIIGQEPDTSQNRYGLRFSADPNTGNKINTQTTFDNIVNIKELYAGIIPATGISRIWSNDAGTTINGGITIIGGAEINGGATINYNKNNKNYQLNIDDSGTTITGNTLVNGTLTASNAEVNGYLSLTGHIGAPSITVSNYANIGSSTGGINLSSSTGISITNSITTLKTFSVNYDGEVTAKSYLAKSDKRLKENIIEYVPEKSILDLPIYKYDFIGGSKNQIGCLAQELQEICPEIVKENQDGHLSIQESKIVYLLLDEVKKLKAEIEKLKIKED